MRTLLWLLVAGIALPACNDRGLDVPPETLVDYSIDQARYCFCPGRGVNVRITVRADTIASIVNLETGTVLSRSSWGGYRTIKGLFEERAGRDPSTWIIQVTMDSTNTYPARLSIMPRAQITDVSTTYVTSNLVKFD